MMPYRSTERHTRGGVNTREIPWEDGVPQGWECECPICNKTNRALYDHESKFGKEGQLISWPNTEFGDWCPHATGAYAGARMYTGPPQFLFR